MTVDQSMPPGSAGDARGRRTDLAALRAEWQAVHGELSNVVEAILAQIFATASRQAVEVLARLEREGTDLLGDLETRRAAARAEMTELAGRLEHLERRVSMAEEERRQALDAAERATSELLVRARHQADEIVGEAEARADARLVESEQEAARRIAEAEARAAQIVEEARQRAAEVEREVERREPEPEPIPVADAAVVEDQLRGLAERISRLLQTTSEVTSTEATGTPAMPAGPSAEPSRVADQPAARTEAPTTAETEAPGAAEPGAEQAPAVLPLRGTPDHSWPAREPVHETASASPPMPIPSAAPPEPVNWAPSTQPYAFEPRAAEAPSAPGVDEDEDDLEAPEHDVVVPLRPRTTDVPTAPISDATDMGTSDPRTADLDGSGHAAPDRTADERENGEDAARGEVEPDPWIAPASTVDDELDRRPAGLPLADADDVWDTPAARREADQESSPARPNGVSEPAAPFGPAAAVTAGPSVGEDASGPEEADAEQSPVQTLVFQAVPNFQAALALERALKGLPGVSDVRVADFDERQLTFLVTHELGTGLTRNVLALRSHNLDLVDSGRDRAEFIFRP